MTGIRTAELLSIGTELTVGETRDTNAGDLARDLTLRGVVVQRMAALPDDLEAVTAAYRDALASADLVVSTGGLGPTPDDLTREAVAACLGERPSVDPEIEAWLRELFDRRKLPFPDSNRKQAWRIPSSTSIPNDNGTAPGWWVEAPGGRLAVVLPGPPREMRPMWDGWVVPRLEARGLGRPIVSTTLRLTGIGESAIADRLGDMLQAGRRPMVATYARRDAVDIRIWTHADPEPGADPGAARADAEDLVRGVETRIREVLGNHVWAEGEATWADTLRGLLDERRSRLSVIEIGFRGALVGLLGEGLGDRLALAEVRARRPGPATGRTALELLAEQARAAGESELGLAAEARPRGGDTSVTVAVAGLGATSRETRVVFLDGSLGRSRAAVAAAAVVVARLRR